MHKVNIRKKQSKEYNLRKSIESFDRARDAGRIRSANSPSEREKMEIDYFNVVTVSIPWSGNLSKNRILGRGGHGQDFRVFLKKEGKLLREQIAILLKNEMQKNSVKFVDGKIWMDIFVQKPTAGAGDAINVLDMIADAIQDATGVNDKWYCIKCLDWEIKKVDPHIYIEIGQGDEGAQKICSYCGIIQSVQNYTQTAKGPSHMCNECRKR